MTATAHILKFERYERDIRPASRATSFDGGGGGGDNGGMELTDRVAHLETDMKDVRDRLARIESGMATKDELKTMQAEVRADVAEIRSDIHRAIAENQRWTHTAMVGMFSITVLGIGGLLMTIWNASKPAPAPAALQQPAPIVIQVPVPAPVK